MTGPTYTFAADFSLVRDQIRDKIGDTDVVNDPILKIEKKWDEKGGAYATVIYT